MPARHILIPLHDFSHGGTERIALRLAGKWLEEGRRVTVLAGAIDGPMAARVPHGASIEVLDPARPRSTFSRVTLGAPMAETARKLAPDATLLVGNFHFTLARALRRTMPATPVVGKVSNPLVYNWFGHSPVARAIAAGWTGGIDALVAMSEASQREIAKLVPGREVVTIPDPFLDDGGVIAGRANSSRARKLLWVGRLEPQKDPLLAIEVAAELQRRGADFSLTLLGSGAMDGRVREEVDKRHLKGVVAVMGHATNPAAFYDEADLLLMTSRYEGVPAVIGESLAHGLPFIATPGSEWMADLAAGCPRCGTVIRGRSATELADAIAARADEPYPTTAELERAVGGHRLGTAAASYLALFDRLCRAPA
jgi:glycosyltransferase involved in cell wall biosynthesis